ncbi:virulence-associated E family protein [Paenibacillus alvei TS-15]|uniref:Virulence-associated E family protein n=1 Tax=Paenibacillus alvei TS-15 TaxID=1117108 RepID=S9TYZ9_PAEAL|nr:virulence-associated E family protein [Paenibacillus alvei]EPY07441.1 virulence-associated E family protein [Paenibacillus alvei TS-15]
MQNDRQLTISSAGSRHSTNWQPQVIYWSELVERLRTAARGTETLTEYLAMPKSKQDELKDVGGFVAGSLSGGRRKANAVTGRDVITLDLDSIPSGGTMDVLRRVDGLGCAYAVYSTRKHEEAKPRLRVLVPLDRTVTADEYEPLARKLAAIIGIEFCDPTTFQAIRLMYWPSCCADSQYIFHYGDKPFLSADGVLAMYADWRNIAEWPQVPGTQQTHVRMAAKQGDPTTKPGVVGAFCRVYNVLQAMEKFLPGIYTPTDDGSGRYTYVGGSTAGGAVIYDDEAFLYSHHATDPCSGRLVNAFDMVRLHLYGDQDDEAKPGTPTNKLPSYTAMCAFAMQQEPVAGLMMQERYEKAIEGFGDDSGSAPVAPDSMDWIKMLEINSQGIPQKSSKNVRIVLENDPNLKDRIRMDLFADAIMGAAPLPWPPRNTEEGIFQWRDDDDAGLREYIHGVLSFRTEGIIQDGLTLCARKNQYNPVTSYLNSLEWDGVPRLDTLFIDYLGAADTPYTRAVTRKSFTAAVARAMLPGIKYDTMPVLTGAQGLGKTTLIQKMGKDWFNNSIESFEGKEAAEMLQGVWIVEVGEMGAYSRSDVKTIKGFLSRTEDSYRAAYARKTEKHPRRCVFFGTSNDDQYLRDPTGGRRFWPIDCGVIRPTKQVFVHLDDEVNQLWAEAVMRWRMGESLILSDELEIEAKRQQELHAEVDPWDGIVSDFAERQVPPDWGKRTLAERKMFWSGEFGNYQGELVPRDRICAQEVWLEALNGDARGMKRAETQRINNILDRLGGEGWVKQRNPYRFGPHGKVKGGYTRA